ncbi:MAG: type II toxin-antitoxin system VapC family toxin [Enterobacterales bacterium]|nr:type II toxin-antitoxin system VapC family toxin [Enterobacterales bacterium]
MLIDANILLYAVISDYPQHSQAKTWFEQQLNGPKRVALPWQNLLAFVRISTSIKLFSQPLSISNAWHYVESWINLPTVWVPQAQIKHADILCNLLLKNNISGNLVNDTHLAALAIEHGLTLYSCDRDFARFEDLNWVNPIG